MVVRTAVKCDTGYMPTTEDLEQVGSLLRERREELGLRKSDVARRIGVTPAYVSLIETAAPRQVGRGNPTRAGADVLTAWARVLEMDDELSGRLLNLAGHTIVLANSKVPEPPPQYEPWPWPRRRELLLAQTLEVLRLAEDSPRRDELADLIAAVLDLVKFRLLHDEER